MFVELEVLSLLVWLSIAGAVGVFAAGFCFGRWAITKVIQRYFCKHEFVHIEYKGKEVSAYCHICQFTKAANKRVKKGNNV
ncbi:hypothetical protein [Thalassotalea euphylliae]|uniref:Uncharacterized protein n=1 Tax=Thalassotalea euphylliae TaxID=1655234 RepID=A0A3E0U9J6_9GAMM|nr:hypothetical protein [Thalassotalea euphylliae]REL32522.1 hypothetical protein DXX94_18400 [Thalassotalea euphylliae]